MHWCPVAWIEQEVCESLDSMFFTHPIMFAIEQYEPQITVRGKLSDLRSTWLHKLTV